MISFIVPAYNEELLIGRTLRAIQAAAAGLNESYEIVVADDASTDGTAQIALQHGARVVTEHHRQIAATRNSGARAAEGELLLFVDADTAVTPEVVRAAVEAMRAGAVGGGCTVQFDGRLRFSARMILLVAVPLYRAARLAAGCFVFCKRSAFEAVGGFDEGLFGAEEVVLSRALARQGKFVLLRERVLTSGRKVRTYSTREILTFMGKLAFTHRRSLRRREGLDIWYGDRRDDPEPAA